MALVWPNKRFIRATLFGVISGAIGALAFLSPWGQQAEERFGLAWLFHLRGPTEPPADVVIVAVDKASSDALGVPYDTTRWPRDIHARLLDGLTSAGAKVVTFDLLFKQPREHEDSAFARAITLAGNVALLEFLAKDQPGVVTHANRLIPVTLQQRVLPTPELAAAAVGSGPFTLPKIPERVSRFWTFDENAGGALSLPAFALLVYAQDEYTALYERRYGGVSPEGRGLPRNLVKLVSAWTPAGAASLLERMNDADVVPSRAARHASVGSDGIRSAIALLRDEPGRYLNFYGPPRTLATISYANALRMLSDVEGMQAFAGKAVFVGVSSPVQWHHQDEFLTVFSDDSSGLDLSSTEILATGFANLLELTTIRPLKIGDSVLAMLAWGLLLGVAAWLLRPSQALVFTMLATAVYLWLASRLFATQFIWAPLFVPLLIMVPLMLFSTALFQHRRARADLNRIQDTFGHYLPRSTVDRLVQEGFEPLTDRRTVFGVCLMTDAQGYTAVAEKTPSDQLVDLVNDYLEVVIGPIQAHGGEVSDIKGDSVLALWASRQDDLTIRSAACRAMSDIEHAVTSWNGRNSHGAYLPTRIGLHCGTMTLASVGAADHYEQRAVGDIVNTASRLEQLSKELGTRLLLSEETARDVDGIVTRYLGSFVLKGRTQRVRVCELLGWGEEVREQHAGWIGDFSTGVDAFEREDWNTAEHAFNRVLETRAEDSVARWYLGLVDNRR